MCLEAVVWREFQLLLKWRVVGFRHLKAGVLKKYEKSETGAGHQSYQVFASASFHLFTYLVWMSQCKGQGQVALLIGLQLIASEKSGDWSLDLRTRWLLSMTLRRQSPSKVASAGGKAKYGPQVVCSGPQVRWRTFLPFVSYSRRLTSPLSRQGYPSRWPETVISFQG